MNVALIQMRTGLDKAANVATAVSEIRAAAQQGADLAVLPEMFCCPYDHKYFAPYSEPAGGPVWRALSEAAQSNQIWVVGGSFPESDGDQLYNTCFVFDSQGRQIARHRKVHLFDVDLPGMKFRESSTFATGEKITVFDTPFGKMGCAVCFDLRFPELFRAMAVRGAKIIFLPAQFNTSTGPAHWELSLRMRAVDNELFMVGASAARYEGFSYPCWGHSTVCDPFGQVIASCDETEQILYSDIDLGRVDEVRRSLPTFLHLRRDVYAVAE